ncbi:glycoside hydrolase [Stereum hirsutum FP-91666 SS1]|uniref:glycoside hydrolase n=1 Tax=Stereum hirsutum (strain FP-91666) TaxID=721885 RepID=UPI000440C1CB|nr:glycoside hydrolase [Stereum hirsutum FP-91666 SS1]EIM92628.1 glycoside hydrolase [Stereum hirsutum FP-91666 SS1]
MTVQSIEIHQNWEWKQRDKSVQSVLEELSTTKSEDGSDDAQGLKWRAVTAFPSEVHVELLKAGMIPDPYVEFNEHKVQWVGMEEWLYKTTFSVAKDENLELDAELVFEGLDTFADVYLNGEQILSADNMFRTYRVPIKNAGLLLWGSGQTNTLLLHFKSAYAIGKALEAKYGRVRAGSCNLGDPSRVYVRKAQYGWRWDWGPELMTAGPYRSIHLLTYAKSTVRLSSIHAQALVSATLKPSFVLDLALAGVDATSLKSVPRASVTLKDLSGNVIRTAEVDLKIDSIQGGDGEGGVAQVVKVVEWNFEDAEVQLWWPVGYGSQHLYTVEVTLLDQADAILDSKSHRLGFRRVELIQEPLEEADQYGKGTTFLFQINGVRMFMGGSNWIPADNFLTTITAERYRAWLTLLRDGNQNMVRLWGGGIYEPDVFYDICDELGLLVWQDFQFACGVYPAYSEFVESVKKEAEDNVLRLRHHPSVAIFCGNNEDYQMVLQWGGIDQLPARVLYEDVLPSTVERLTSSSSSDAQPIPYHRGSPYGGKGWDTSDPTIGDVHQWNVWGGKERPWQDEFGMPGMPDLRTVHYWMGSLRDDPKQNFAQSKIMAQHCRAGMFERRFAIPMNEMFRLTADLETHVYQTQLMQSEAVSYAYRVWRREWRGKGKEYNAGVLVWQSNDTWPVTSWAIADYFLRPKPVYYTIARELNPITIGIYRTVERNRENDRPKQNYEFGAFQTQSATLAIWGTNSTLQKRDLILELHAYDLCSSWEKQSAQPISLLPNQSTELGDHPVPSPNPSDPSSTSSIVVHARLLDKETSTVVARYTDWPQPFKHLDLPSVEKVGLRLSIKDGDHIYISVEKPVKGLVLSIEELDGEGEVKWSDNALDVVPQDDRVVVARGLAGRKVRAAWLGKEKASVV